jgi:serine/threonine protein kinase
MLSLSRVTELLGAGQFGQVNRGTWQNPDGGEMEVAVKTLKKGVTEEDKVRFLQEAAISGQFQHRNVVRLQGVVTVGEPVSLDCKFHVVLITYPSMTSSQLVRVRSQTTNHSCQ